jgi:hypothetical protein
MSTLKRGKVYFVWTNCNYSQIITLYVLIIDFHVSAIVQTTTVSMFNLTLLMIDEWQNMYIPKGKLNHWQKQNIKRENCPLPGLIHNLCGSTRQLSWGWLLSHVFLSCYMKKVTQEINW